MPEHDLSRYAKGKIYTIRAQTSDEVYYGSTCSPLPKALYGHRQSHKYWLNDPEKHDYLTSFKLIENPTHYIELVKLYPCQVKSELVREVGQLIRANPCTNKVQQGRTPAEYRQDNAEYYKDYGKKYYQDNIEKMAEYRRVNATQIKTTKDEYRRKNIAQTRMKANVKHECLCGGRFTHNNKSVHMKTAKHKKYIEFAALREEEIKNIVK
jgi:hypothetical protein